MDTNKLIDGLITLLKENYKKEQELSKVFESKTTFFESNMFALQSLVYEALELDGNQVGTYNEGLFQFVIDGDISIWQLVSYVKERNELWSDYEAGKIDLDTFYEKERKLETSYGIY